MNDIEFICATEQDTADVGKKLAGIARKGDVFALFGTLGMGKSVLSRAFVQSLTGAEEVPSPTFTAHPQTFEASGSPSIAVLLEISQFLRKTEPSTFIPAQPFAV